MRLRGACVSCRPNKRAFGGGRTVSSTADTQKRESTSLDRLYLHAFSIIKLTAMLRLLFLFCTAAVVPAFVRPKPDASPPSQPCLAPLQWEGRSVQYDHSTGRNARAAVSYDAQNQRIRIFQQNKKHTPCEK